MKQLKINIILLNKKFWEELIAYFHLKGDEAHRKVLKNSYIVACIRCRSNVFTKPLPSNDRIHIQTHRLMGGIYEVRRSDVLSSHDIHTKFHKDWFRKFTNLMPVTVASRSKE
jgi:hypothetical protein